jgi:Tol biopolymer transport system component
MVTYTTTINGYNQIMAINTFTGTIDQLTNSLSNNYSPSIDGAGAHIAFQGTVAGFSQIFTATRQSTQAIAGGGGGRGRIMYE